jgi:hypothetical protein
MTTGSERRDEALAPGYGVMSDGRTNERSTTKRIRMDKEEEKRKRKKKREMEKRKNLMNGGPYMSMAHPILEPNRKQSHPIPSQQNNI